MIDPRRLRVLCAVVRLGSFSAAAESLGYTQPAISRQIATLEAEVGMRLLLRGPAGVTPTDAGRLLARQGEAILARLAEAEHELALLAGVAGGSLRLATFSSAAASFVPLAIAAFRERHPDVALEVVMADPALALPQLRAGAIDMAISNDGGNVPGDLDGLELVHLFDDPMFVALPPAHPLVGRDAISLRELSAEPWMLATPATCPDSRLFLRSCHEAGFEPRIAFQNDDYQAILGFVAAGVGVALIPDMVLRIPRDDVAVVAIDPPGPSRPVCAAFPAGYRSPAAAAMLTILQERAEVWVEGRIQPGRTAANAIGTFVNIAAG